VSSRLHVSTLQHASFSSAKTSSFSVQPLCVVWKRGYWAVDLRLLSFAVGSGARLTRAVAGRLCRPTAGGGGAGRRART
jgi:hypothetical protein